MDTYIVMYSGGIGSWMAAKRVIGKSDNIVLLFADTMIEDEDLYRFLDEGAAVLGLSVTRISDGRNPWEVFRDVRFLGNSRVDPCSRILKRDLMRAWIENNYSPENTTIVLGIDWTEVNRLTKAADRWLPWKVIAPMTEKPYMSKVDMIEDAKSMGVSPPRLYGMGFHHNNCGGFCVKAGQAQFATLMKVMPERYAYHEQKENEIREYLGKNVTILRDRSGGMKRPMTMREFRDKVEGGSQIDMFDWGGCGCAID